MKIFIGNLPFLTTEQDVQQAFEAFGLVESVRIRKKSGKNSRGFGFVNMPDDNQARSAILALEGKEFMGRILIVTPQRLIKEKPRKDYKAIKKLRLEAKSKIPTASSLTTVEEKKTLVSIDKTEEKNDYRKKIKTDFKKHKKPSAASQVWAKRKGSGVANPWKKKAGGIKKKFKYAR